MLDLRRPGVLSLTLIERARAFARDIGANPRPAHYNLEARLGSGTWTETELRFPRSLGPFILCGVIDGAVQYPNGLSALLRLRVGTRRYLDDVDICAIAQRACGGATANDRLVHGRVDWPRPIVVGRGETLRAAIRMITAGAEEVTPLLLAGFHADDATADAFIQSGELWATTMTPSTLGADSDDGTDEDVYTAGSTIVLDEIVSATDAGNNAVQSGGTVTRLDIRVGDVSLTPLGLTDTRLGTSSMLAFATSLAGLQLREGEQITVRQRGINLGDRRTPLTFIGRRMRDAND